MELMNLRRGLMGMAAVPKYFELTYGQGLNPQYGLYSYNDARVRTTEDIVVPTGYGAVVDISNTYNYAIAVWTQASKSNLLYGGWNNPLSIIAHTEPLLIKIVISKKRGGTFAENEIPTSAIAVYLFRLHNANTYYNT